MPLAWYVSNMTETEIQAQILDALPLAFPGSWWHRNNVGQARMHGHVVWYGLGIGSADIVGCVEGRFVGVEVKAPKGKTKKARALKQAEWRQTIRACKGIAVQVQSAQQAIEDIRVALVLEAL
jgi:hypothetical protein